MKLLHEIVREEIAKFYPVLPKQENGILQIDISGMNADIARRRGQYESRIREDQALNELVWLVMNQISGAAGSPASLPDKQGMWMQAVAECVMIWERANERYDIQLKGPESPLLLTP